MLARDTHLAELVEKGRSSWPSLSVSADQVEVLLQNHLPERLNGELDAGELYLACACALGASDALAAFENRYFRCIAPALTSMSLGVDEIEDVKQTLRIRLFVGNDTGPASVIAYAGQGSLQSLIRIASVRAALTLIRKEQRVVRGEDWLQKFSSSTNDPEQAHFKGQGRTKFKKLFEEAVGKLLPRERSLLRFFFVEKLVIDDIGRIYGVHRATAARWVVKAREHLAQQLRLLLRMRWGLNGAELKAILPLIESQLDLSLDRLLCTAVGPSSHEVA